MSWPEADGEFLSHLALSEQNMVPPTSFSEMEDSHLPYLDPTEHGSPQNVVVLSLLLALALITNLSAFPFILFRRTR